jgi:isopentenyldiphosphate isomerase
MEMIDIVDTDGKPTGKTISRDEAHNKGILHKVVQLYIIDPVKKDILLQKRSPKKKIKPNSWTCSVGGHVNKGNSNEDEVIKETKEEIGIDIEKKKLKYWFKVICGYNNEKYCDNEVKFVYLYYLDDLKGLNCEIQKDEVCDIKIMKIKDFIIDLEKNPQNYSFSYNDKLIEMLKEL